MRISSRQRCQVRFKSRLTDLRLRRHCSLRPHALSCQRIWIEIGPCHYLGSGFAPCAGSCVPMADCNASYSNLGTLSLPSSPTRITDANIASAVEECQAESATFDCPASQATYGPIEDWDVGAVTSLNNFGAGCTSWLGESECHAQCSSEPTPSIPTSRAGTSAPSGTWEAVRPALPPFGSPLY